MRPAIRGSRGFSGARWRAPRAARLCRRRSPPHNRWERSTCAFTSRRPEGIGMFRIGEFSRIARVSARLLRYYDELGLLRPGVVDAATGYRYYSSAQLQRLNRILVLRDLGLSLEQIGGVIDQEASADQLRAMLERRRADAERALAEEAARLKQIEARIAQLDAGRADDLDDVLIRAEPARRIVSMRHTVASFLEARQIVGELARILPGKLPREALG